MKKFISSVIFLLAIFNLSTGQILNVDRENVDSILSRGYWLVSGSLTQDKQVKNIQDVNFYSEALSMVGIQSYGLALICQSDFTISGVERVQNEGFLQLRYRDLDTRIVSADPFVQYQWNGLWGMDSRFLVGCNARVRLFDTKGEDTYAGLGVFYQAESWTNSWETIVLNQGRINTSLKTAEKLGEKWDVVDQLYCQFPIEFWSSNKDLRLYNYIELVYQITDEFQVGINGDVFWNSHPLGETESLMYGYGMNFRLVI